MHKKFVGIKSFCAMLSLFPSIALAQAKLNFFENGNPTERPQALKNLVVEKNLLGSEILLRRLLESGEYENVEVSESSDGFRIEFYTRKILRTIVVNGLPSNLEGEPDRLLRLKAGKSFNERDIRYGLYQLKEFLNLRGYPNAKIDSSEEPDESGKVNLTFNVERNRPCRVSGLIVEPRLSVLSVVNPPVESGALCDIQSIQDSLERQKNDLVNEGRLEADFQFLGMIYSEDKQSAVVRMRMQPGPRTTAVVINEETETEEEFLSGGTGFSFSDLTFLSDEDLRDIIYRDYQRRGYARSIVTGPERRKLSNGNKQITMRVVPGEQFYIGNIEIQGFLPIPKEKIVDSLPFESPFLSNLRYYIEADLEKYRDTIRNIYIENGFTDAEVSSALVTSGASQNTYNLTYQVQSGKKYVVSRIDIKDLPNIKMDSELEKSLNQTAFALSPKQVQEMLQNLRLALIRNGYAYAQISNRVERFARSDKNEEFIILSLQVEAGPITRIRRVVTEGSLFRKEERVILETSLEPGDLYTPENLERARQRILIHGLFATVEVTPLDPSAIDRREAEIDIVVRVRKRGDYTLGLSPAWSSLSGYRFSIDFSKNNLTQSGLRFVTAASISQEKQQKTYGNTGQILGSRMSAGLIEPFFKIGPFVSPVDVGISGSVGTEVQLLYNRQFNSFAVDATWRPYFLDLSWMFNARLVHEQTKILPGGLPPIEAIEQSSAFQIDELVLGGALDLRNNREWPTRGGHYEMTTALARFGLGSEVQYNRYAFDLNQFYPIYGRFSGAISFGGVFLTNTINKTSETAVPPSSRRANLVGRAQVRGFPERVDPLGPLIWLDLDDPENSSSECVTTIQPVGATNLIYLKHELRYRSPWFSNNLGFAWFVDSGSAFLSREEENKITAELLNLTPRSVGKNSCRLNSAQLIGNEVVNKTRNKVLQEYLKSNYVSTGLGARVIIPNFASINLDWGLPIRDPADGRSDCVKLSEATRSATPPTCVNRRKSAYFFNTIPGAIHLNIGATF